MEYGDKNECHIAGRLSGNPELRYVSDGKAVCNASLAVKYKDATTFIDLVAWEGLAERLAKAKKGQRVKCVGCIAVNKWEGKDGVKRYRWRILVFSLSIEGQENEVTSTTGATIGDSDIPFRD